MKNMGCFVTQDIKESWYGQEKKKVLIDSLYKMDSGMPEGKNLKYFENLSKEEVYDHRKEKFLQIGRDQGFSKSTNLEGGGLSYQNSNFQKFVSHLDKNNLIYGGLGILAAVSLITLLF